MNMYQFDAEIPIDRSHSLDQNTGRFQTVRDGLPELVKNSKDQYARLEIVEQTQRQIVVMASSRRKAIGVLDFGGAKAAHFENWKVWSSRDASRANDFDDVEGG